MSRTIPYKIHHYSKQVEYIMNRSSYPKNHVTNHGRQKNIQRNHFRSSTLISSARDMPDVDEDERKDIQEIIDVSTIEESYTS